MFDREPMKALASSAARTPDHHGITTGSAADVRRAGGTRPNMTTISSSALGGDRQLNSATVQRTPASCHRVQTAVFHPVRGWLQNLTGDGGDGPFGEVELRTSPRVRASNTSPQSSQHVVTSSRTPAVIVTAGGIVERHARSSVSASAVAAESCAVAVVETREAPRLFGIRAATSHQQLCESPPAVQLRAESPICSAAPSASRASRQAGSARCRCCQQAIAPRHPGQAVNSAISLPF